MEDKNFKELFEDLIQSVKMCEKNDNNCFTCDRVYFQNSDCFITNPIYSDLYDAFSLIIKNDSEGTKKFLKFFQILGKFLKKKTKKFQDLEHSYQDPNPILGKLV